MEDIQHLPPTETGQAASSAKATMPPETGNCDCQFRDPALPEKFWDENKGKLRVKALVHSYKALEKRFSNLLQEMKDHKDHKKKDWDDSSTSSAKDYPCCPASADDYDIIVDHGVFDKDPWINQVLHEAGFSNDQVQLVYDLAEMELLPLAEELGRRYRMEHDVSRLEHHFGGKARWRETSRLIRNWAMKNLPKHAYQTLSASYEGILAMYAMIDHSEEPGLVMGESKKAGLEEKDLRRMMQNPKYWQERDPAYIRKVTDGFTRLYGN